MPTEPAGPERRPSRAAVAALALAAGAACVNDPLRHDVSLANGKESVYGFLSTGTRAAANGMLSDAWDLGPRYPTVRISPITWSEDPFGDPYWRFLFYSLRPTSNLLWGYLASGDERFRDKLVVILDSYARHDEAHPASLTDPLTFGYKHGAGYRALVLTNTIGKLERTGDLPPDVGARLRAALRRLGAFLADGANYEPLHNHGLAEAAGLAALAASFPEFPESQAWLDLALARLDALFVTAVDADGVEVENSPFYHFYVLGFGAEIERWARSYGLPLSQRFSRQLEAMLDYGTFVLQPDGGVPLLGASVDLDAEDLRPSVYEPLAARSAGFAWAYTRGASGAAPASRARRFPVSGQVMLRSSFGTGPADVPAQTFVTLNVGPWRSTHNHRDVLGITLYGAGAVVLPDAGLYTYAPGPDQDFFTGTRAHNVVVVDGLDQATTGAVQAGLTATGPSWAYQSGLHGLYGGVTVRRGVLLLRRDLVLVVDRVEAASPRAIAQTWHLPPSLSFVAAGLSVDAVDAGGVARLAIRQALGGGVALSGDRGALSPLQGWVSARYGVREPSWAFAYETTAPATTFVTLLATGDLARLAPSVAAAKDGSGAIVATACAGAVALEARVADLVGAAEQVIVSVAPPGACP